MRLAWIFMIAAGTACRPDPGIPDYSEQDAWLDAGQGPDGALPGPSPYVPGTRRLAFGLFYEGGASETLLIDDATRHYYIFGLEGSGAPTYAQQASSDRVEGLHADELTFTGTAWWGGGIIWDTPTDLTSWTSLHVSLASSDAGLASISLRLTSGAGTPATATVEASAYGWKNDGAWHHLVIPLADFRSHGAELDKVRGPFLIGGVGAKTGERLRVDALYAD